MNTHPLTPTVTPNDIHRDHRGWVIRAGCVVDGFPGEVEIISNAENRRYNSAVVSVFDSARMTWMSVYIMPGQHVQNLPVLPDADASMAELNRLAEYLHQTATFILTTARTRQAEVDAEAAITVDRLKSQAYRQWAAAERAAAQYTDAGDITVGDTQVPVSVKTEEADDVPDQ